MSYSADPRKVQSIWVDPYLYKYIRSVGQFNDDGQWVVKGRLSVPPQHNTHYHDVYFSARSGKREIRLISRYSKHKQLYCLVRYYKSRFQDAMIDYIEVRHDPATGQPNEPIWPALEKFLRHHQITESDYSMETAYKVWQRSGVYSRMKRIRKRKQHEHHRSQ